MKNCKTTVAAMVSGIMLASGVAPQSSLRAAVKQEHPRIWLTAERKATLLERAGRNTQSWRTLTSWCESNFNDSPESYLGDAAYGLSVLKIINFALVYQLNGNTAYADKALEIAEYIVNNPPRGSLTEWFSYYRWYPARYAMPALAIALDWCWDEASTTQRTTIMNGLDELCSSMLADTDKWAWVDPSNNYYMGDMWGLLTGAYVLSGHDPYASDAVGYLSYARDTMLEQAMRYCKGEEILWTLWGNRTGRSKGGIWNEGTAYGSVNTEFLCSALQAVESAEGLVFEDFEFPGETQLAYIYMTYPGGDHTYADGDGASWGGLGPTTRMPLLLANSCTDGIVRNYGQFWLDMHTSRITSDYKLYNEFIWYDDTAEAVDYRENLTQDYYYAEGVQTLFWRNGWGSDATWIMMKLGVLNTDHAHNGMGNFIVYKGGYLVADKSAVMQQGELFSDAHHNVLFVQPVDDKKLYWGHSDLEHLENTADYLYFAGDLTEPYTAQPDYRYNRVAHKEREFFLLKSDQSLVIMDRARTFDPAVEKVFRAYMENTPSSEGNGCRVSSSTSDLVLKPAWPSTASASLGSSGIPLVSVSSPGDYAEKTFVNVMRVDQRGGSLNTAQLQISDPAFAGAAFQAGSGTLDYVTVFSNDIEGDIPQFDRVTLSYNYYSLAVRVFVMNLAPSTTYYFANSESGGMIDVTLSTSALGSGGSATTSAEGVLSFFVYPGEDPQPLTPPAGIRID